MPEHRASSPGDRPARLFLAAAAVFLIAASLYAKTVTFEFQTEWDDGGYVENNPKLVDLDLGNLTALLTEPVMKTYHPVQMLSYAFDRMIWGMDPAGFHLTNVILHALNSVLFLLVLSRLGVGRLLLLVAGALLFAVHPVHSEAVSWIAERKTLLAAFFVLLSFLLYARHLERPSQRVLIASLTCFLLAVFSKPSVIGFPIVLAVHEYTSGTLARSSLFRLALFAIPSVAQFLITLQLNRNWLDATATNPVDLDLLLGTVYPTMSVVYWKYGLSLFWPAGLNAYYDPTRYTGFDDPVVLIATIALAVVILVALFGCGRRVRFWSVWTIAFFLPYAQIIPHNAIIMADRYLYLPSMGIVAILLLGLRHLASAMGGTIGHRAESSHTLVTSCALGIALLLASLTWSRTEVWRDESSLWQRTATQSPNAYIPRLNLGVVYHKRGAYEAARREYLAAFRLWPNDQVRRLLRTLPERGQGDR